MQLTAAPRAQRRQAIGAVVTLLVLAMLAAPAAVRAAGTLPMESAGWQGRAIADPQPNPRPAPAPWPAGWSAGHVELGAGSTRAGGSDRVRELQRRLRRLGYRPGPVDGIFGPRTQAATLWFQRKHGLAETGRVSRATLAVLQARSGHKPLSSLRRTATERRDKGASEAQTVTAPRGDAPLATDASGGNDLVLLAILSGLALLAGLLAGTFAPRLLPARSQIAPAVGLPTPQRHRQPSNTEVFGYVSLNASRHTDQAISVLVEICARRGWSMTRVIHDSQSSGGRLADRPGLSYALDAVNAGLAAGIVVPSLDDVAERFSDLAIVIDRLSAADGFLVAADDQFDSSTPPGRAMAEAVLEIGRWPHAAPGRFSRGHGRRIASRLGAMRERDMPPRALTEGLDLAETPPQDHVQWRSANVEAAIHHEHET